MADPTAVNGQITDAVTQANLSTLGNAPAVALSALYQAAAQAAALAAENAVTAQQNANILANAVITRCVQVLTDNRTTP